MEPFSELRDAPGVQDTVLVLFWGVTVSVKFCVQWRRRRYNPSRTLRQEEEDAGTTAAVGAREGN